MRTLLLTHLCLALAVAPAYAQGSLGTSAQAPGTGMSRSTDTTSPGTTDPLRQGGQVTDGRSPATTAMPNAPASTSPNMAAPMGVSPSGTGAAAPTVTNTTGTGGNRPLGQAGTPGSAATGTATGAASAVTTPAPAGTAMEGDRRDGRANVMPSGTAGTTTGRGDQPGANSFTEGQARARMEDAGFSQVGQLTRDADGVWRGTAMRDGRQVQVGMDFQGTVTHR